MTFEEFVEARLAALLRFAVVLTGERGLAEDVVQEVLLRAHQKWRRIGTLDAPEQYVRRMIVNEYLSWRRRWSRIIPQANVPEPRTVADHADLHSEREALRTELDKLRRRQRAVHAGLTDSEIAEALGCSPGTVRGYASRALAALRVDLRTPLKERI